jgi:hypothetical protein
VNLLPVAQPIPATPPAHGLLVTADEATDLPFAPDPTQRATNGGLDGPMDRWGQGFVVQPENCIAAGTWDPDCDQWPSSPSGDGPLLNKTAKSDAPANETSYIVKPFVIETAFNCDATGLQAVDFRGRARRQLVASSSKAMEYELATGTQKGAQGNQFLEDAASVVVLSAGSSFSPAGALARLGAALSACGHGGRGMIHAPTVWVGRLMETGDMVTEGGQRLLTKVRGDRIVAGSGYPGTGPAGVAPPEGDVYVYATGPVVFRLSEPEVFPDALSEAMDRKKNNVEYRAERMGAVYFDPCCHFVIQSRVWSALA